MAAPPQQVNADQVAREQERVSSTSNTTLRQGPNLPPSQMLILASNTPSDVQLHHVLVVQHVVARHGLAIEHPGSPDARRTELVGKIAVDQLGELENRASRGTGERRLHVRRLARLLGVHANDVQEAVQGVPQLLETSTGLRIDRVHWKALGKQLTHHL